MFKTDIEGDLYCGCGTEKNRHYGFQVNPRENRAACINCGFSGPLFKDPGVPGGWRVLLEKSRDSKLGLTSVVLCEQVPHKPGGMNYATWWRNDDPEVIENYDSTCTSGHYFEQLEHALRDFQLRR